MLLLKIVVVSKNKLAIIPPITNPPIERNPKKTWEKVINKKGIRNKKDTFALLAVSPQLEEITYPLKRLTNNMPSNNPTRT